MRLKSVLIASAGALLTVLGAGYSYVFVAGAPQIDGPRVEADQETGLSLQPETFTSQAMKESRRYAVVLPPHYAQNTQCHYPVIFLLHGGHDDERAFYDKYALTDVLDSLYKQKKLTPSIIVMPDGNDHRGSSPLWDPQYFDGPNGSVSTLIGDELVQQIKAHYRAANSPKFWAIGGVSSGGWGAVNIGLHHLNNFKTLFSHSGYFIDDSGPQNSPKEFIKTLSPQALKGLAIYLDAGQNREDSFFLHSSQDFHDTLNQMDIENDFQAFPGGHGMSGPDVGWNYFHKHLSDSLAYVGQRFKQAEQSIK